MLGTYPTLPYPTLTPNPTPNPPHPTPPRPTPLNPTQALSPTLFTYLTQPYPDPESNPEPISSQHAPHHLTQPLPPTPTLPYFHPTQPLPYSCPAIHHLALPNHTLPYLSAVYVGPFRCFGSSIAHFSIWVRFGPFVPFRFGPLSSKQSVQTGWTRSSPSIACQNYLNFTIVDLTNVEL